MTDYFEGKEILITGGTGSLGKMLIRLLLTEHNPKGIRVLSRDELKQWQLFRQLQDEGFRDRVAFLIGDVRDLPRLKRAFAGVDIVIHAAAMKQVGSCEDNPQEAIRTNIDGAVNVMNAAIDCGVERVMNVSTDKAVKPVNLYGATKMAAEKLFIAGNVYTGGHKTSLSCCRYGNVLGSRGSVAHVFKAQADAGLPITITHKAMTRFWITLPKVARFLLDRIADMKGGEVFVPKMKSMSIHDMALAMGSRVRCECKRNDPRSIICPWCDGTFPKEMIVPEFSVTGIRQGEKLHEILFHEDECCHEQSDYYTVLPKHNPAYGKGDKWELTSSRNPNGELNCEELLAMLKETEL